MKFSFKVSVLFILIVSFVSAILLVTVYFQSEKRLEEEIKVKLENQAVFCINSIDSFLSGRSNEIPMIAGDLVITSKDSTPEEITERLIFFRNTLKWYVSFSFFTPDRIRIADTSGLSIGRQNEMTRYWKDIYAGKVSVASDVGMSNTLNLNVVYFASRVKDKEGKVIGVVAGRVLASKLVDIIKQDATSFQNMEILNRDGTVIFTDHIHQGIADYRLPEWNLIEKASQRANSGAIIVKLPGKSEEIYSFAREQGYLDFEGNGWTLLFHEDLRVVFTPINYLLKIVLLIFLCVLPIILLIAYFFSKSVTKSLSLLSVSAKKIGEGNLDNPVNIKTNDEFGILANTMNQMMSDIKESNIKLEEYSRRLEQKVKERTEELENAKAGLEIKVEERTRELKEKYDDLNKAQEAMLLMVEDLNNQAEKLKEAQEKLIRSEKLATLGQLASSVAHELRNPMGVIKNAIYYLNMLKIGENDPDIKENMDIICAEIERSDKIIGDLLEFSRIKKPILKASELSQIIREAVERLTVPENIAVVLQLDENLPQIEVDSLQMQQVFYNLATNAIQAMEKGGTLAISSFLERQHISVSVRDTGCGIPEKNLEKIFDPLFSTKVKGTGLGLPVVASIVEGHKGKIKIESHMDKGTNFMIELPLKNL